MGDHPRLIPRCSGGDPSADSDKPVSRSGQLDQISEAIGRLSAQTEHLHQCVDDAREEIKEVRIEVASLKDELTIDKGDLAKLKAKGAGILIGVSLASGFVGSKLAALAHLLGRALN